MTTETRATVTNQNPAGSRIGVRALVQIGMLSAIAVVLMLFEVPLPFAPSFYEIDFSEVPVLVGCFVMGPVAGAAIEFVKNPAKLPDQRNRDSRGRRTCEIS